MLNEKADNENNNQTQFDVFKAQMLKMFEEQEKKHSTTVNSLLQKINTLNEENQQYKNKVNELEKKINELESNTEMINKVQDLEQKVENLEEQSQCVSQRETTDDQLAQAMDLCAQNSRDFMNLQRKVDQLEKSGAKILEDQNFMTREVEKLNSFVINNEEIKIYVNIRCGPTYTLNATSAETVGDLKKQIQKELGYKVDAQIINFNGWCLEDEYSLHDYNINNESTVQLALRN